MLEAGVIYYKPPFPWWSVSVSPAYKSIVIVRPKVRVSLCVIGRNTLPRSVPTLWV